MLNSTKNCKQKCKVPMQAGKANLYFTSIVFLTLLFSVCGKTNAQSPDWQWVKSLSATFGVYGNAIVVDPRGSGDVYIAGGFEGEVDFDPGPGIFKLNTGSSNVGVYIAKYDAGANFLWAKSMKGSGGNVFAVSMAFDPAGSGAIYTTGKFAGTVDFDPGPNTFNLTSATNTCSVFTFCGDIFISKLDGDGNFEWAKGMGSTADDFGHSIAIDPGGNGDVYATGQFVGTVDFDPGPDTFNLTSAGFEDVYICKFNGSGDFLWAKVQGGTGSDVGESIAIDPNGSGDLYTTGTFQGTVDFDPGAGSFNLTSHGATDIFISKLDGSGNFVWAKAVGGTGDDIGNSIVIDHSESGDIYTTGGFKGTVDFDAGPNTVPLTSAGSTDIFISKLDRDGTFLWARAMGGSQDDFGTSIAIDTEGNGDVYTIGHFNGTSDFDPGVGSFPLQSAGNQDIFISKLDASGNFVWAKAVRGSELDFINSLALDASYLYVTGFSFSPSTSFDAITLTNANTTGADLFFAKLDNAFMTSALDIITHQMSIYPNPASNELTIEFDEGESLNVGITMFNVLGAMVFSSPIENVVGRKSIDISSLATGIYFVELNIDGDRVMKKVVKE